jgi:DNA polymerase-1
MSKIICLDLETTGLNPRTDRVRLVQMFDGKQMRIVDAFKHPEILDELVELVEDTNIVKVLHNAAFDLSFIRAHAGRRLYYKSIHDTMVCEQLLMAGYYWPYYDKKSNETKKRMPEFSLAALVMRHLNIKLDKSMQRSDWGAADITEEQMQYAARDVEVLVPLYNIQLELLDKNNLVNVATLEFNTIAAIVEMQHHGLPFSWDEAEKLRAEKKIERAAAFKALEDEVRGKQKSRQTTLFGAEAGVDLNMNSPAQVTKYMREKLGFDVDSSDVETLKSIDHPFTTKLLTFRGLEKALQFFDQFEEYGAKSGRLYPYYSQCRAATGRMSSSKPNGQQIPKRGANAAFRRLFKTTPGKKLVKVDFAAIELRTLAAICKERTMIKSIHEHVDLHKLTASTVAGVSIDEVTKAQRQSAKAVNFGFCFGMSAKTFKTYAWMQYSVKVSEEESQKIRDAYFNLYKDVAQWHVDQKRKMLTPAPYHMHTADKGFFITYGAVQKTIIGRRRNWPNFAGETTARPTEFFNSSVQGSAADLTKSALVALYNTLPENVRIVGCIHDEILCECDEADVELTTKLMMDAMCGEGNKMMAPVPIEAEAEVGDAWGK